MFKSRSRASKLLRQLQLKQAEEPEPPKQDYLSERECHRTYSCIHCRAHLANHDELISKLFQGNHGRAYLFNKVVNVGCKQAVERELLTGLHAVADIYCDCCETTLGWKYEQAFVPSQKYKEGKYIIELVHMLKENNWDLTSYNSKQLLEQQLADEAAEEEEEEQLKEEANSKPPVTTNERSQISELNTRQLSREALVAHRQPGGGATRKPISTSSSYTTISLRLPEQSNLNLNSSGGSSSVTSSSTSSSHENLGQLAKQSEHHRRDDTARCISLTNDTNEKSNHLTTRQTIRIIDNHSQQQDNAADDNNDPAAISVQQ